MVINMELMKSKSFFFKQMFIAMICCISLVSYAQYNTKYGDEKYEPRLGQSGKDVIWLPTSTDLVTQMVRTA